VALPFKGTSLVVNTWFVQCRDRHHGQLVVVLPFKELYSLVVNTWFVQCRDRHHGQLVVALPVKAGTSLIVQPN